MFAVKDSTTLAVAGIAALTIIEIACLFRGIDHAVLAGIVAVISALSGYEIKARRKEK